LCTATELYLQIVVESLNCAILAYFWHSCWGTMNIPYCLLLFPGALAWFILCYFVHSCFIKLSKVSHIGQYAADKIHSKMNFMHGMPTTAFQINPWSLDKMQLLYTFSSQNKFLSMVSKLKNINIQ